MKGQESFDALESMSDINIVRHCREQLGMLDSQILDADDLSGAFLQSLVLAARGYASVLRAHGQWRDTVEKRQIVDGAAAGVMGCFMAIRTRYAMLLADRDRALFLNNLTVSVW